MLSVTQLHKEFPTPTDPLVILNDLGFELEPGQNMAVVGPSGSGKSTLLHVLGTLDRPTSGSVRLQDEDPFALDDKALAAFRNRHIGFIFQEHYLLPQLSVLENVLVPVLAEGAADASSRQRAEELIERVGLTKRVEHRPAELSGGERQRVAVARAMIMNPVLILADEPTGSLDRRNATAIGELLVQLQSEENRMLIAVTHSAELAQTMQRQFELLDGRLEPLSLSGASGQ